MSILLRLKECVLSWVSVLIAKFENPIVRTERAISLLKDLQRKSFDSLAQVKALIITTKEDLENKKHTSKKYEQEALDVLKKSEDADQADKLASSLLSSKLKVDKEIEFLSNSLRKYEGLEQTLEAKAVKIRQKIRDCEFELASLKSRMSVATTLKEISKSTSGLNDDSVNELLKDSELKVRNEEALATAYESLEEVSLEDQVAAVLGTSEERQVQDALAKLKEQL